jgi:uncharacterized protein YoxC
MEWTVVTVIIALVGLVATFVKMTASLTKTLTELTVTVRELRSDLSLHRNSAHESHKRLWEHNTAQDKKLEDHEKRIYTLEQVK